MNDFNPSQLARIDTNRLADYTNNLNFYKGSQWEKQGRHRQLVFNYAKVAIDKVTSYLMQGLTFACYPGDAVLTLSETKGKELDALKAKVIHAEGEFEASEKLSEAAGVMSTEPMALQLRYLQTLTEISVEKNSTIIFPLPMDIVKPLLGLLEKKAEGK